MPRTIAALVAACALASLAACGPNADQQTSVPGSVGAPARLAFRLRARAARAL